MYSITFESDNGKKYVFGKNGNTVFDMGIGDGLSVTIGTSQGFGQVGETVENQTIGGRTINVKGTVYNNIPERKKTMRNVMAPFTSGKLVFNGEYYMRVYVKNSPSFSPVKLDGRFTMQFYAPYPFFRSMDEKIAYVGIITPQFSFPVNYSTPHRFGTKSAERYTNINNSGDAKIPFGVYLSSDGICNNITITNLKTLAYLKINGTLSVGDTMKIYRDDDGVLKAELTSDGVTSDAISMIDEGSTLFELDVGDNLISASDDTDGANLTASFMYREAVASLYES